VNASTEVDVGVVDERACPGTPPQVRIVTERISPPGILVQAGSTSRLFIHAVGSRVLVVAVQAPTEAEFQRFLPQAEAVLSSISFGGT
jgi:hypothetical protein